MNLNLVSVLILTFKMTACAKAPAEKLPIVGSDRDAHGCIGLAQQIVCGVLKRHNASGLGSWRNNKVLLITRNRWELFVVTNRQLFNRQNIKHVFV